MISTNINHNKQSICIVGAGIAGLSTAIKLKIENPDYEIVILEKRIPENNTQIAGMRFREHKPVGGQNPFQELQELLEYIDDPEKSRKFSQLILQELKFWEKLHENSIFSGPGKEIAPLRVEKSEKWFGPQWEKGNGKCVLDWMKKISQKLEIKIIKSEVLEIKKEGQSITSLIAENQEGDSPEKNIFKIEANNYILAAGSASGFIASSTNKSVKSCISELALESELSLVGLTNNMFHPFGRCKSDGTPLPGCYGTDELDDVEVYLANGELDSETTLLLQTHKAHDKFPEIIRRFSSIPGKEPTITLKYPSGKICHARVSHHYCQLGLLTEDGVSVQGIENLYAIGDAEGWYLTNHKQRLPGFALSKCLVDAELVTKTLPRSITNKEGSSIAIESVDKPRVEGSVQIAVVHKKIKITNTKYLLEIQNGDHSKSVVKKITRDWYQKLAELGQEMDILHPILELSLAMVAAHENRYCKEGQEPILIDKEMIAQFTSEIRQELLLDKEGKPASKEGS